MRYQEVLEAKPETSVAANKPLTPKQARSRATKIDKAQQMVNITSSENALRLSKQKLKLKDATS